MPSTGPVNLRAYGRLLRTNRNYRLLWMAQTVSELGDWLYAVAVYSLILKFTGSAQAVALAFVLQVLPQFFIAPAAGVLNDRLSRRKLMMFADWMRAGVVFLMLFVQNKEALPILYLLLFIETMFWALFEPGRSAVIPNITSSEEETLVANALGSTTWSVNLAIGSAIGGVIAAVFGRDTVFVINALSFVASALLIRSMRFREPHLDEVPPFRTRDLADFSPILEGIRYVRRDRRLFATIFVKGGIGFLGANWVLLPIFGERIYPISVPGLDPGAAGMLGMSLLMGCRGIGALFGPILAGKWSGNNRVRFRTGIIYGFLIAAAGYFLLGVSPVLLAAGLAVVLAHAGGSTCWVFSTTLLQLQTEDRFRGRVFSAEFAFNVLVMSISTYTAGLLTDAGFSVYTVATMTGYALLIPGVLWWLAQKLWREEPLDPSRPNSV
ncbi:MAG: MFS transporter [Bryobacteraceae bacterium]|nr:MFS transporter [Bryobacteraceae bacterium]